MAKELPGYKLIGQGYNVVPVGRCTATAKNVTDPKGLDLNKLVTFVESSTE
jgi:hypothetical protein